MEALVILGNKWVLQGWQVKRGLDYSYSRVVLTVVTTVKVIAFTNFSLLV